MNRLQTQDWVGYHAKRDLIDFWILTMADGSPTATQFQMMVKLRDLAIGDARSDARMDLTYSSTGAIYRSAMNRLQHNGWIEEAWKNGRKLSDPLHITRAGREYLATLPAREERGLFA
jgi:DNA-binding PadR family transcriptional regulator